MKSRTRRLVVPARRTEAEDLLITDVGDELVVYDSRSHQAHTLNRTATCIWNACDGQRTVADITRVVSQELSSLVDERVVWHTLQDLSEKELLSGPLPSGWLGAPLTRREMVQLGGIAAIPVIASILVPAADAQTSGTTTTNDSGAGPTEAGGA